MIKKALFVALLALANMAVAAPGTKSNTETITVNDKTGTLKEERVQSIESDITFTSAAGHYTLIEMGSYGNSEVDEHINEDTLAIPSWTLFSW